MTANSSTDGDSNGENYAWKQTLADIDISIQLPVITPDNTKSVGKKNIVKVEISKKNLRVLINGNIHVEGDLYKPVKIEDSTWLIDSNELLIHLEKLNKMEWWKCVIIGHAEVDTSKLEPENSKLSDLDGDTRSMVEKMMFDQRQKALGLQDSETMKKSKILEQFKNSHPELDFSQLKQ